MEPKDFSKSVEKANRLVNKRERWRVSAYDAEHYVGSKLHKSKAGSTIAVAPSGDIISLCRRKDNTIRGLELLQEAINNAETS